MSRNSAQGPEGVGVSYVSRDSAQGPEGDRGSSVSWTLPRVLREPWGSV